MSRIPPTKVAHLKRCYLPRREPFVGYQITALQGFDPIVLCREQERFPEYEITKTYQATGEISPVARRWADLNYRLFRRLTGPEVSYLTRVLADEGVALLHTHYAVDAGFFLPLKRRTGLPLVVSCYGYDTLWFASKYHGYGRRYLNAVYASADRVLAMSPDMKKDLLTIGCPEEKIVVHYYGVETVDFAHPERTYHQAGKLTILMVAAFEDYKGHAYLLQALRSLVERLGDPAIELRLVGEGPNRPALEEWVKQHGLERYVTFAGFVPRTGGRIVAEYRKADIFVMPSAMTPTGEKEGIPGAMVEAMASGIPVVASRHAGIPHVVEDGQTGILVDERDVHGLASALDRLIHSPDLRRQLGTKAAAKAISSFDARVCAQRLEGIYSTLLADPRRSTAPLPRADSKLQVE